MDQQQRRAITRHADALSKRIWRWDPLALAPPEDEYDRLSWPLLRMLRHDAPADEITHWLDDQLFHFFDPKPVSSAPTETPTSTKFVADTITWFKGLETT